MLLDSEKIYNDTQISASMLNVILESGNIGYFSWDIKNKTIQYNLKWFKNNNFKIKKNAKSLRAFFKLMSEKDRDRFISKFRAHLKDHKKRFSITLQLVNKNDKFIWIKVTGQVIIVEKNGEPCLFVGTLENIDEEKKLIKNYQTLNYELEAQKNELENQKRTLESINRVIPGMMFKFKYNFNGKVEFEYLSDGMKKLFGFEKEHFKDFNNFIDLLAKDFREPLKKEFESKLPKLKDFRFDGKYNLPKNETKWIHSHATLEKIGDNYVIYSGIAYDITDRIKLLKEVQNNNKKLSILNDKLKYDNHKLKFIFDSLDTIVIIWSNYGVTHYINSFTEKVFGYTDEEFIGNSWMNLIVPSKERTGVDTKKLLEEVISNPDNFAVNHNFNNDKYGNLYYVNWSNLIYSDYYNKRYVLSIGNILEQFSHNQN